METKKSYYDKELEKEKYLKIKEQGSRKDKCKCGNEKCKRSKGCRECLSRNARRKGTLSRKLQ